MYRSDLDIYKENYIEFNVCWESFWPLYVQEETMLFITVIRIPASQREIFKINVPFF